jgi:hypothetical protein
MDGRGPRQLAADACSAPVKTRAVVRGDGRMVALVPRLERTAQVGHGVVFGASGRNGIPKDLATELAVPARHLRGTVSFDPAQGVRHLGRFDLGDRVVPMAGKISLASPCRTFFDLVSFQLDHMCACHSHAITSKVFALVTLRLCLAARRAAAGSTPFAIIFPAFDRFSRASARLTTG